MISVPDSRSSIARKKTAHHNKKPRTFYSARLTIIALNSPNLFHQAESRTLMLGLCRGAQEVGKAPHFLCPGRLIQLGTHDYQILVVVGKNLGSQSLDLLGTYLVESLQILGIKVVTLVVPAIDSTDPT